MYLQQTGGWYNAYVTLIYDPDETIIKSHYYNYWLWAEHVGRWSWKFARSHLWSVLGCKEARHQVRSDWVLCFIHKGDGLPDYRHDGPKVAQCYQPLVLLLQNMREYIRWLSKPVSTWLDVVSLLYCPASLPRQTGKVQTATPTSTGAPFCYRWIFLAGSLKRTLL
jgi:hypothetical protein